MLGIDDTVKEAVLGEDQSSGQRFGRRVHFMALGKFPS